jgi:hypothetical protein
VDDRSGDDPNGDMAPAGAGWQPDGPPEIIIEPDRLQPVVGPGQWDIEWVPRMRYRQRWQRRPVHDRQPDEITYTEWPG